MCLPAIRDDGEAIARLFSGPAERWRATYDALVARLVRLGPDVVVAPGDACVSVLRGTRRFAVVQPVAARRLDIGIKLHGLATTARFEDAAGWNETMTHRAWVEEAGEVDSQLLAWLRWAYAAAAVESSK